MTSSARPRSRALVQDVGIESGAGGRVLLLGAVLHPDGLDDRARVVARLRDGQREVSGPLDRAAADAGSWTSTLDLPAPQESTELWDVYLGEGTGARLRCEEHAPCPPRLIETSTQTYRLRPYVTERGNLTVETRVQPRHAEVTRVRADVDALRLSGSTPDGRLDRAVPEGRGALELVQRGGERRVRLPLALRAGSFSAEVPWEQLVPAGGPETSAAGADSAGSEVWDLFVEDEQTGQRLRLGRRLGDVPEQGRVRTYPTRRASAGGRHRMVQPYFTERNSLSLRSAPHGGASVAAQAPAPTEPAAGTPGSPGSQVLLRPRPRALLAYLLRLVGRTRRAPRLPEAQAQRPRACFLIIHAYGMGGTIRTVLNLAGHLAHDHEVEVISVLRRRQEPFMPVPPGVRLRALHDSSLPGPTGLRGRVRDRLLDMPSVLVHEKDWAFASCSLWTDVQIVRALRRLPPGVLIGTRPALNMLVAQTAPARLATIGQEHMNYHAHKPELARDLRRVYERLDALAVLTEQDEQDYRALLQPAGTRVVRIPNALPDLPGRVSPLTSKVVVAAGRLTRQKGFDLLIPAFAHVVAQRPDWSLRIYGNGRQRAELQQLVLEHDLSEHVLLMGQSPRLGADFASSSLFVLSSRYEGFGMVLIEAMSKGLPVVSFDCPEGPREIITPGVDGLLVPNGDVEALGRAMLTVIEDDDLRRSMGAAAVSAAARYDGRAVARSWAEVIADLSARVPARRTTGRPPRSAWRGRRQ